MNKWFECTIRYEKQLEDGKIAKVTERYLVDALTFTEAEARIIEEMKPLISGEFEVANINPQKYSELFWNESGDKWFKTKVNLIVLDEEKGVVPLNGKGVSRSFSYLVPSWRVKKIAPNGGDRRNLPLRRR